MLLGKQHVPEIIESVRKRLREKEPEKIARFEKTKIFVGEMHSFVLGELENLKSDLEKTFSDLLPNFQIVVSAGGSRSVNDISISSPLYFNIHSTGHDVSICIMFHAHGKNEVGLWQLSAIANRSGVPNNEEIAVVPFQFSYADEREELFARFKVWLDEVLAAGLVYWQRDI